MHFLQIFFQFPLLVILMKTVLALSHSNIILCWTV